MNNQKLLSAMIGNMSFSKILITDFGRFNDCNSPGNVQSREKVQLHFKMGTKEPEYKDELDDSDYQIEYILNDNDKLACGIYVFSKKYSNPQLYLEDYKKFKVLLTEKFGKPVIEKENWNNNSIIEEKNNYGQAVAENILTVWNTNRSVLKIVLVTTNEKYPGLQIYYTSAPRMN